MAKNTTQAASGITIPIEAAKHILELFDNVEAADSHFQRCQSDLFRQHVKAVYDAKLVRDSFGQLRGELEKKEKPESDPIGEQN